MKVLHVVGSRSGFFRISQVFRALRAAGAERQVIVYSGHREDLVPHDMFLDELGLPSPDHVLGVSTGSSTIRTGRSLIALESIVLRESPDWIFAVGDVDSALAAALVARKNGIPLAHLEAGLRHGHGVEEAEINRVLTDQLSDALYVAEPETRDHLVGEGIDPDRIHFVGNTAADTALRLRSEASSLDLPSSMGLEEGTYIVALLTQTDSFPGVVSLEDFLSALDGVAFEAGRPTVLVVDAPAAASVKTRHLEDLLEPITVVHAPSYVELLALVDGAGLVVTNACEVLDSATVLGVPCIAIGDFVLGRTGSLEPGRHLSADELAHLPDLAIRTLSESSTPRIPERWDGNSAPRIAQITMAHRLAAVA